MGLGNGLFNLFHCAKVKQYESFPGPKPCFPLGNAMGFLKKKDRPWEYFAAVGREYGSVSVVWLFGTPIVILHDAALIEEVMISRRLEFYKDSPCPELFPVLTDSSPNINNGEVWQRKRDMSPFSQPYLKDWLGAQLPSVRTLLQEQAATLAEETSSGAKPLQPRLQRMTFDGFSIGAVGKTLGDRSYDDFMELATQGSKRMLSGMPFGKELSGAGRAARGRWHADFQQCIDAARAADDASAFDLCSTVLRHGTELSNPDFSAELGNIYFGGCFSVPSAIVTALWSLTEHPEELAMLRKEIDSLSDDFTHADLEGCEYLDCVVREGLRYRTAVPLFGRRVQRDGPLELGGHQLPGNAMIFISCWLLHWDAEHWEDPDQFRPSRWLDGVAEANPLGSGHFFPMGMGPRMCMGWEYAIYYMKLVIAVWFRGFDVETGKGQPFDHGQRYFFGVRMPWGLETKVHAR